MYEELVENKSLNVDLAKAELLEKFVWELKWADSARDARRGYCLSLSLQNWSIQAKK